MAIVDELVSVLGYKLEGQDQLNRFNSGMERAKKTATEAAAAITRVAMVAATAFATGAGFLAKGAVEVGATFEALKTTLTTIEGSAEAAQASLDWVQDFAKRTPYDLNQVAGAFVRMRAYGLDPMNGSFEAIGNAASAMGKDIMQGVEAVADAAQGENERLKEFGIRAKVEGDKVTYSWQQNGEQMSRTIANNGEEIVKTLTEIFDERYTGAMAAQATTWNGLVSNMGDTWVAFQKKIADAGFFDWIKRQIGDVLTEINRLDDAGTLDMWAKGISDSFIAVGESVARFVRAIYRGGQRLAEFYALLSGGRIDMSALQALGGVVLLLVRTFMPLVFWIGLAYLAIDDLLAYLEGADSVIGRVIAKIQEFTGVSEGLAQVMTGLAAALGVALLAGFQRIPGIIGGALMRGISGIGPLLLRGLGLAFGVMTGPVGWAILAASVATLVWMFWDELSVGWDWISTQAGALFAGAADWFGSIDWTGVAIGLVQDLWGGLQAAWQGLSGMAGTLITQMGDWFANADWLQIGRDIGYTVVAALLGAVFALGSTIVSAFKSIDWPALGRAIVDAITNALFTVIDTAKAIMQSAWDAIKNIDWLGLGTAIVDGIKTGWTTIGTVMVGIVQGATQAVQDEVKKWFDVDLAAIGAKMASDLLAGLQSIGGQISAWWSGLFQMPGSTPEGPAPAYNADGDADDLPVPTGGNWMQQNRNALDNFMANSAKTGDIAAGAAVVNDNSTQSSTQNNAITVNQTVTQATQAPMAAAQATGDAVANAANQNATRIEAEPGLM